MKKLKNTVLTIAVIMCGIILLTERNIVADGISKGLSVCGNILIPSLLPFMILSSFAVKSGLADIKSDSVQHLFKKIFRLPSCCLPAVFFGFTGGYPVGANIIASLYEDAKIGRKTALRLMSFCVNAGPAFIITATGTKTLGNTQAGILLFAGVCVSSVLSGVIFSFVFKDADTPPSQSSRNLSAADALIDSVENSIGKTLTMCGWVIAFSAVSAVICSMVPKNIADIFFIFAEVTSGVETAAVKGGLPLAAAVISSGGLCVMCQLIPAIKKCGIKATQYLVFRIVNAIISYFTAHILLQFFPLTINVSAGFCADIKSNSAPATVMLLMMCAVFIYDLSSGRIKNLSLKDIIG